MILKVLWMYHDVMDLYGDAGNMHVLEKRCKDRDIELVVDTCGVDEVKVLSDYDVIFIGGGADKEQALICKDLVKRKTDVLEAIEKKTFFLLICGGYQFFGQYYIDGSNNKIEGLNIFDYYSENDASVGRCTGNIAIEANLDGKCVKVVGFENHGGQTKNVKTPFGKVLAGHGNTYKSCHEGFYNGSVLGTYIHGPLFPKNPEVCDFVITKGLSRNYGDVCLQPLDDTLEMKAKEVILKRLQVL